MVSSCGGGAKNQGQPTTQWIRLDQSQLSSNCVSVSCSARAPDDLLVHLRYFCQKVRNSPTSHACPDAVARQSTPVQYSQSGSAGVHIHPPLKRLRDGGPDDKGSKVKHLTCLLLLIQRQMMQWLEPFHSRLNKCSRINV